MVWARTAPVRASAASKASSASRGAPWRPAFTTTTGFMRAAALRPLRKVRARRMRSTYSKMPWVCSSRARWSSTSPKSMSAASPIEIIAESPTRCAVAQSSIEVHKAPDWETMASGPAVAVFRLKVALRLM